MLFDVQNQIMSAQAFTGAATVSEDAIQKVSAAQDPSIGRMLSLVVFPTVAQGAGSTMTLEVIQADDAALTSNVQSLASKSILAAAGTVNSMHEVPIPQGVITKLYLGARVTLVTGTTTITLDGYIMPSDEVASFKSFPKVVGSEA
jgi:hypothetical protein